MLYHSLGIKMQINISSSFLLKLHEKSEIINLIRELCIPVLALKCHWRFLPDFFCWSFMKNQEQIKKRRPHCDTQLKTLKISYSFFTEGSWKVFFQFLLKLHQKSRNKSIWEEYVVLVLASKCNQWFPLVFYWSFMKSQKTEETWRRKKYDVKIFDCSHCDKKFSAFYFVTGIDEIWRNEDTKSMMSKFLIALIVIRNSAFYFVTGILWNLQPWRHKKYGVKTFYCSHCDKHCGLFWQKFL